MTEIKVVAIMGPFRAKHWWLRWRNIRRAQVLALHVWELGAVAYCPHAMAGYLDQVISDDVIMPGLLELCQRCDAGMMGEGWEASAGLLNEKAALEKLGKPVFYTLDDLRAWLTR